jgi:hypothetical protein
VFSKMNERTKRGLEVLEAALLLGILGDALLRATPWGLNITLWMSALFLAVLALLMRGRRKALEGEGRWLALPLIFFSLSFAWRDSLTLRTLDMLALLVALSLIMLRARGGRIRLAGLTEYVLGGVVAGFNAFCGAFMLLFGDIKWKEITRPGWSRHVLAIVRGLAIAIPLVFFFGVLLVAADAVFEGIINQTLHLDFDTIFSHALLLTFLSWLTAGFLRSVLLGKDVPRKATGQLDIAAMTGNIPGPPLYRQSKTEGEAKTETKPETAEEQNAPAGASSNYSLGIVEIGIVVGLLNLLFLAFVVIQVRYFFGGADVVRFTQGLTYADYARRGFFELVWVAALVLPLLLMAHWLLRKDNPAHERIFRLLAGMQVVLLFVIMTSAVARMRLYQQTYGLTELRLYTMIFMGWLALVFVWFAATVLRGQRERFACGALVTGFLIIGALHVMNPDAFIVRVNVAQMQAGRVFDASYNASLSADAVPALLEALPTMNQNESSIIANRLLNRRASLPQGDWRSWNWSRSEAASLLQDEFGDLWQAACLNTGRLTPDAIWQCHRTFQQTGFAD